METEVNDRIQVIITEKNLNPNSLSTKLGCSAQSIRNILAKKNKPSYDILASIITTFIDINPTWLLVGKGTMILDEINSTNTEEKIKKLELENIELKAVNKTLKEVIETLKK